MSSHDTVKVFSFRVYDMQANRMQLSGFKARRDDIVSRYQGEVLEGTGHEVAREELDEHGRYRRVATGWGELN